MSKLQRDADLKPSLIDLEASSIATGGKQAKAVQPERLSGKGNYSVYWIRLSFHDDMFINGYIGITKNIKERIKQHKKSNADYIINRAKKKYGWDNLIISILYENLTLKEALRVEYILRPNSFIGWNGQAGGFIGVNSEWYQIAENRIKHSKRTSEGTKRGIKEHDTKEARSERAKKAYKKNEAFFKTMGVGEKNGMALLKEWQVKLIRCKLYKTMTIKEMSKKFNVKPYVISRILKMQSWKHVVCDSPDYK